MRDPRFQDARILIVDDEPANVLFLERLLRTAGYTQVSSTTDSVKAAAMAAELGPDLILLDLQMPLRNGFEVLDELAAQMVDSYLPVLVLTADVTRTARERALSSGAKDFLTKPLDATEVLLRIHNLLETRFLHKQERVLLEQTLQGSIRALTDILALINPAGFSRALRARDVVVRLLDHLGLAGRWEVELAAMLSQVGSVTLPADTLEKFYFGRKLTHAETAAVSRIPEVASRVICNIPRMEEVARILAFQDRRFDGKGAPPTEPRGADLPWGARVLKLVLDLDVLETRGIPPEAALEIIRDRDGWYDSELVGALAEMRAIELQRQKVVEVEVRAVRLGMVLAEDLRTTKGMLLVARGQEVSERLVERLRNSEHLIERRQRVHVIVPPSRVPDPTSA